MSVLRCYNSGNQKAVDRRRVNVPAHGTTTLRRPVMHLDSSPIVLSPQDAERFWSKVDKSPGHGPGGKCWPWTGGTRKGYGCFYPSMRLGSTVPHSRMHLAHRVAWTLTNGPIPIGMEVLHGCDNNPCCNPECLRPGTHAENMADMAARGRASAGERHPFRMYPEMVLRGADVGNALLTVEIVRAMREEYAAGGVTYGQIGQKYGVSTGCACHAIRGDSWAHVENAVTSRRRGS